MAALYSYLHRLTRFLYSKRGRYTIVVAAALFILLLLLRSCMNDNDIKETYRIGRDNRWYTVNLMGKEKNLDAFADDFFLTVGEKENMRLLINFSPYEELLPKLQNKTFDGILTTMQPEVSFQQTYLFSEPIVLLGPVLVVPSASQLDTWEELKYRVIGILNQSPTLFEMSQNASIQLRLYENALTALTDLMSGKIDGVILPLWPAHVYTHTFFPGQMKIATQPLTKEGIRLMALKNARGKALIDSFNNGLQELKTDGTYLRLLKKWDLLDPENLSKQVE